MPTYFLALAYKGTRFAGFQIQDNAITIQGQVERAMATYLRENVQLTGSSRTDAGVHANRNFFHFSIDRILKDEFVYHVNAILPPDIAITGIYAVPDGSHSRFDAIGRRYKYHIYNSKNPFLNDRSWYYPYPMDLADLNQAASYLLGLHDFTSFAKRRTQVYTHLCTISVCQWHETADGWVFTVEGNRFLRGMVRALVGTMVKVGRQKISFESFQNVLLSKDSAMADFSAPGHGLFLDDVIYPSEIAALLQ
jgi:tRNA pseudouridine38-40 synthase